MITYEENDIEGEIYVAKITEEGKRYLFIKGGNSSLGVEYANYLEWVEAGNNPEEFWTRLEAGDN